jgi:predicted GIY-YIG superfamily endonuclease
MSGSTPAASTNARQRRALSRRSFSGGGHIMKYVYILQSLAGERFYTGITDDLVARLSKHNSGAVTHTSKFRPWRIKSFVAFADEARAIAFEKYLKSGSGRAFAKARL